MCMAQTANHESLGVEERPWAGEAGRSKRSTGVRGTAFAKKAGVADLGMKEIAVTQGI
jgi:hypothetical protein